jgi:hypothetical protein
MPTFAEQFCQHYHVLPENYERAMLWRCLHRRTWMLVPFLRTMTLDYFAPDLDLIRAVGRVTHASRLREELSDFHAHPYNLSFARRRLKLRISTTRTTRLVRRLMRSQPDALHEAQVSAG